MSNKAWPLEKFFWVNSPSCLNVMSVKNFDRKPAISLKTLKIRVFNTLVWLNQGFGLLQAPAPLSCTFAIKYLFCFFPKKARFNKPLMPLILQKTVNGCTVNDFITVHDFFHANRPLTIVENFPLTSLIKLRSLTNGNLFFTVNETARKSWITNVFRVNWLILSLKLLMSSSNPNKINPLPKTTAYLVVHCAEWIICEFINSHS